MAERALHLSGRDGASQRGASRNGGRSTCVFGADAGSSFASADFSGYRIDFTATRF
jgi:hypothetical protein